MLASRSSDEEVPMLVILGAVGAAVLLLIVLWVRRGGADRRGDLIAPPPGLGRTAGASPPPSQVAASPAHVPRTHADIEGLADKVGAEVRRLMAQDRKIEAIKLVRAATRWDLKRAKDWVERL